MKYLKPIALCVLLSGLIPLMAKSQCCAAGNPASAGMDLRSAKPGILRAGYTFRSSYASGYFEGDHKLPNALLIDHAGFDYSEIMLAYSILPRIEITAALGNFHRKAEYYNLENFKELVAKGIGDLNLQLRIVFWKDAVSRIQLIGICGVTIPVGVFDLVENGVKFPVQLQPSSGAVKYQTGLFAYKELPSFQMGLFAQFQAEFAQKINSANFNYHYGNYYAASLGSSLKVNKLLSAAIQVRGEIREMAEREGNHVIETTGSKVVFLSPQCTFRVWKSWTASLVPMFPVYKYYNGVQLANNWSVALQLSGSVRIIK
jgi:hypothetical protein